MLPQVWRLRAAAALALVLVLAVVASGRMSLFARWQGGQTNRVAAQHPSTSVSLPATLPSAPPGGKPAASEIVEPGRSQLHVPVLMYHYIRVPREPPRTVGYDLSVTPDDFRAQMDWLAQNGYRPVTLRDVSAYLANLGTLPARSVVLTFDDGYADFYSTAWPVLREHHFTAVAYLVSGFLGRPGYVTAEQVAELDRAGVEVGAHTVTHVDLTIVAAADLVHELVDGKASLEHIVNHPVLDFSYPSGRHNPAVEKAVQAAGFDTATTTEQGAAESAASRFAWPRVRVEGQEPLTRFAQNLGPLDPTVQASSPTG
ncbi:MAG: polysaccharide deacetylase family protein [Candidatus Dormibacter sp.]|uniref:polysaccharide deacetylase family protein n=1 Tax=Candidatus Dormibacter sp. TaxID=2973982 RepID=UPI000DB32CBC|nr:MAG: polysaccharide deacetylase [Candidatus Dormibacteraeota bacterium]